MINSTTLDFKGKDFFVGIDTSKKSWKIAVRTEDLELKRESIVLIRDQSNSPLYHLTFHSRNALGLKFWEENIKLADPQLDL